MEKPIQILPDVPKTSMKEDLFRRENLVDLIVSSILNHSLREHPSTCIGVYGKWGEGKTTVLNFVEERLLENGTNDSISIVHFNPWIVNNEESLLKEFFNAVIAKTPDKKIKDLLIKYGGLITFASKHVLNAIVPGVGSIMEGFVKDAQNAFTSTDSSLTEQKALVSEAIKDSGKHLVVFIDDIDRLDSEEIHTLFRLIRQVADFPNTVYVLVMDPSIVSKSIKSFVGNDIEDGRCFLEKIVQVPVQLPQIPRQGIRKLLCNSLEVLFEREACSIEESLDKLSETLSGVISTPRLVIRYINQLAFVLPMLKEEVNIYDLCCVESIKVVSVGAYLSIYNSRSALLKEADPIQHILDDNVEKKRIKEQYDIAVDEIVKQLPAVIRLNVCNMLTSLFSRNVVDNIELIDKKYIQSGVYFPLYFIQIVPEGMITSKEIDSFVDSILVGTNVELTERMDTIIYEYNWDTLLRVLWQSIRRHNGSLECVSKLCVALSLTTVAKNYSPYSSIGRADTLCVVFLKKYMSESIGVRISETVEFVGRTLKEIYSVADLNYCMCLNAAVASDYYHCEELNPLHAKPLVDRFLSATYSDQLKYSQFLLSSVFHAMKRLEERMPIEYLIKALSSDEFDAKVLLKSFVPIRGNIYLGDFVKIFNDKPVLDSFINKIQDGDMDDDDKKSLKIFSLNLKNYLNETENEDTKD